jgi:hypothetical protein
MVIDIEEKNSNKNNKENDKRENKMELDFDTKKTMYYLIYLNYIII